MSFNPSFDPGDLVEWKFHPLRLLGTVKQIVDGHFHEIELADPPPSQSSIVRLISSPLRKVERMIDGINYIVARCDKCGSEVTSQRFWFAYHTDKVHSCGGKLSQHHN